MNDSDLDLRGRIAYLLGKSEAFGQPKWTTAYLIEQIIDAVAEHMKNFPSSPYASLTTHVFTATDLMVKWLKDE